MATDRDRRVRGEHRFEGHQFPGSALTASGERTRLERAGQTDRAAFGRASLDLVDRLVVREAVGVVADGLVIDDGQRSTGCGQQQSHLVFVAVSGDRDTSGPTGPFGKQRTQLGIADGVVSDVTDIEQTAGVVNDGGGQPPIRSGRRAGWFACSQSAIHTHERHGFVLLPDSPGVTGSASCQRMSRAKD